MDSTLAHNLAAFRHLDLSILRSFVLIADGRSFGETAIIMDRSPSAITLQIQKLECFLGARLLNRSGRSITLTRAGETLLGDVRKLLDANDQLLDDFNQRMVGIAPSLEPSSY